MNVIILFLPVVLFSFVIRTIRYSLYYVFLCQLKEYRIDRLFAHLKTSNGQKLIFGKLTIIKWFLLVLIILSTLVRIGEVFRISIWTFWFIWFLEAIWSLKELVTTGWRIPILTPKVIIILVLVFTIQFGFIITGLGIHEKYLFVQPLISPFLDKLLGSMIALAIVFVNIPGSIYKRWIINKAAGKIAKFKHLIVIGITGSYGKTSTKEFLATILSEKFKVAKTPEFTNTDIGIANYILKELKPEHEVLVVEMGAYKKGEIKTICDMLKPKAGIITGINEQHLELFGSIENTMRAKFELIESLPEKGVAIFNGDNKYYLQMVNWSKKLGLKTLIYNTTADVKTVKTFTDHIEFTLVDKNYLFRVNLLGKQAIDNLLAAIYVAKSLGLTTEIIRSGIAKIVPTPKTMQSIGKVGGMMLVDDTFNANPDGVKAAADFMKIFKGKKILVLTPLIELGAEAEKIHAQLGEHLAKICDLILVTNLNYNKSFIGGVTKISSEEKVQVVNAALGVKLIRENLDEDGVVLFEGKETAKILNKLLYV